MRRLLFSLLLLPLLALAGSPESERVRDRIPADFVKKVEEQPDAPRIYRLAIDDAASCPPPLGAASASYKSGIGELRGKRYAQALSFLEEAARLEPRNGRVHLYVGVALVKMKRTDEATAAYARYEQLCAQTADAGFKLERGVRELEVADAGAYAK